jgi:hypothetical protein
MLRRRPVARAVVGTAVVAGTAGAVQHRQNQRWQQKAEAEAYEQQMAQQPVGAAPTAPAPPAAAAVAAPAPSHVEQLQQLAALREQGVLTDAEFEAEKSNILNS